MDIIQIFTASTLKKQILEENIINKVVSMYLGHMKQMFDKLKYVYVKTQTQT